MKIGQKSSQFRLLNFIVLVITLFSVSTVSFSKNIEENPSKQKAPVVKTIERRKKFILTSYQYETTSTEEVSSDPLTTSNKKYILKSDLINNSDKILDKNSLQQNPKPTKPIIIEGNLTNEKIAPKTITKQDETQAKSITPRETSTPKENIKTKKLEIKTEIISKYKTRSDLIYKYSNDRQLGRVELFLPFYQTHKSLVFTDIRYWLDNNSSNEGNLGMGYRKIFDDEYILGGYGFYDRKKSQYGNIFSQFTTGAELLTVNYDLRANLYSPTGNTEKSIGNGGSTIETSQTLSGYNVVYNKQTKISNEYVLKGYDIEIGRKLPFFDDFRVFIAKYKFYNQGLNINGYRYRGLYTFLESENSKLFLEGEYSSDNARNEASYMGFRYSYYFGNNKKQKLTDLEKRMTNQVIRDLDIVTQSKISSVSSVEKIKSDDGNDKKIIYVNNNVATSGNGTIESPYKTLIEAQNNSSAYNIIYVYRGDGTSSGYNQGIILKDYQKIYGQYIDFKLSDITNNAADSGKIFITKTDYSVISNTGSSTITAAKSNTIAGLDISSTGQIGINYNDGQLGVTIQNNYIHGNTSGINITSSNYDATNIIQNNRITNNSVNGITITSDNSSITTNNISNNTISSNLTTGLYILSNNSSSSFNTVSGNTANSNTQAISIESRNSSSTKNTISGNNLDSNTNSIYMNSYDSSSALSEITLGNSISSNINKGISINSNDSSNLTAIITNNTIKNNSDDGINLSANATSAASTNSLTVNSNAITKNKNGVVYSSNNSAVLSGSLSENTINNNTNNGILSQSSGSSQITNTTINNTILNNVNGIKITSSGTSNVIGNLISGNTINNNGGDGINISSNDTSSIANSTLVSNSLSGNDNALSINAYNTSISNFSSASNNFNTDKIIIVRNDSEAGSTLNASFGGSIGGISSSGNNKISGKIQISNATVSAMLNYWNGGDIQAEKLTSIGNSTLITSNFLLTDPFAN